MQVKSIRSKVLQNALKREHSAILLTFNNLPFSIKNFVLSIFKWPLKTSFTVFFFIIFKANKAFYFMCIIDSYLYQVLPIDLK